MRKMQTTARIDLMITDTKLILQIDMEPIDGSGLTLDKASDVS
jgi:hypothetical protein